MPEEIAPVTGVENPVGVANATPESVSGVAPSTPVSQPDDAEILKQVDEIKTKYERDISQIKSKFQSRESELQRELKTRESTWKNELQKIRMQSMDEDAKKTYEQELREEKLSELAQENESLRLERDQELNFRNAISFFLDKQVPFGKLVTDQGYDAMLQSGWNYLTSNEYIQERAKGLNVATSQTTPAPLKSAPPVDTAKDNAPSAHPTWNDWTAKLPGEFNVREKVYEMFQSGRISADQVPLD